MLTRIDHVMICVPDLAQGIAAYTRIGFNVELGGVHPGKGTHNAIAFHQEDYLELLSVHDRAEHLRAVSAPGSLDTGLLDLLARGGGFRYVIVQSDDLPADVLAMRGRGVDVSDAVEGGRRTPAGRDLRWRAARLGPKNPLPIFLLEHLTPLEERRPPTARAGHPNGVLGADRVYIAVPDVAAAAETYSRVLGMPVPPIRRGNVIKADMAVFDLGANGPHGGATRRARSGRRSAVAMRAGALPGPVPHVQHGGRGALDGRPRPAAAVPRHPQHGRGGDARRSRARLRRLHRPGRPSPLKKGLG